LKHSPRRGIPRDVPTIFTEDGFRFFFYSNDHEPVHVHVRKGDADAVFNMIRRFNYESPWASSCRN
jgi:hypothetical protein